MWSLLVVSLLSWRAAVYYTGGLDPVVLAKSLLSVVAFVLAFALWQSAERRSQIGIRTVSVVSAFLSATILGGWAAGVLLSSVVTATRLAIVGATVVLLVQSVPMRMLVRTLSVSLVLTAVAVSGTGVPAALTGVRLHGMLLPLNPNQLAMMFGVPLLLLAWEAMGGSLAPWRIASILGLTGLIWLTGSRTGLAAALLAVAIVILLSERVPAAGFVGVVLAIPVVFYISASTGLVAHFVERGGGTSTLSNLSSRTIAWHAAFSSHKDFWQLLFGQGLSAKTVAVTGTYWDTQVLDSSWVSAYVQGGWVGMTLLGLWVVLTGWGVLRIARPARAFWVALFVYCMLWGITASGLLDSYVLFILMATTSLAGERTMRSWANGAGGG